MANALILGGNSAVGGYLARLLQARGHKVFATPGGTANALADLGITADVTLTVPTETPQAAADLDNATIFAIADAADPDLIAETFARAAAAPARPRLCHIVDAAALRRSPTHQAQARAVAALRAAGHHAVNAVLHAHDSRLGDPASMPAQITIAAYRAAQGSPYPLRDLTEAGPRDWGWTPEYVDAVQRLAALPRPQDLAIGSGHTLTTADFAAAAFAFFKTAPPALDLRPAPADPEPPVDTVGLKAVTGWAAMTHGTDLVRALCEGAAGRAALLD